MELLCRLPLLCFLRRLRRCFLFESDELASEQELLQELLLLEERSLFRDLLLAPDGPGTAGSIVTTDFVNKLVLSPNNFANRRRKTHEIKTEKANIKHTNGRTVI